MPDQSWYFTYQGHRLNLDDLPLERLVEVEKATEVPWFQFVAAPFRNAGALLGVVAACCDELGIEAPKVTTRTVNAMFELGDDVVPDGYVDGVPDPKAAATEPATTS